MSEQADGQQAGVAPPDEDQPQTLDMAMDARRLLEVEAHVAAGKKAVIDALSANPFRAVPSWRICTPRSRRRFGSSCAARSPQPIRPPPPMTRRRRRARPEGE